MTLPDNERGRPRQESGPVNSTPPILPQTPQWRTGLTPRDEWDRHLAGYLRGYADGIEHGRLQMDEELATIQRAAAEVVMRMSTLPIRDAEADRETAARREARWSA